MEDQIIPGSETPTNPHSGSNTFFIITTIVLLLIVASGGAYLYGLSQRQKAAAVPKPTVASATSEAFIPQDPTLTTLPSTSTNESPSPTPSSSPANLKSRQYKIELLATPTPQ